MRTTGRSFNFPAPVAGHPRVGSGTVTGHTEQYLLFNRLDNYRLATACEQFHQSSNQITYWAVIRPFSGSTKCRRCEGTPDAAIESLA